MVDGEPRDEARAPESAAADTSPAAGAAERELRRDDAAGVITGVAAGLGRHTGIDPVVWRTAFAVTALGGGTGLWLYAFAWLLMRDARGGPALLEQLLNRRLSGEAVLALLGGGLALGTAFNLIGGFGWTTLVLAVPLVLGGLIAHNRGVDLSRVARQLPEWLTKREPPPNAPGSEPDPAYYNPAQPWAAAPSGPIDLAVVARQSAAREAPDPDDEEDEDSGEDRERPPRPKDRDDAAARPSPRRGVSLLGVSAWIVAALTAVVFVHAGGVSVGALLSPQAAPLYLGGVITVCGVVLVVGTWAGNPRGVAPVAALVTVLAVAATTTDLTQLRFGDARWRPAAVSEVREPFELGVGQARLDLTALPLEPGQEVTVRVRVGFGSLDVLVPDSVRTVVHGRAGFGRVALDDRVSQLGVGLALHDTLEPVSGSGGDGAAEEAVSEAPTLNLVLDSYAGDLEVWHVAA